MTIIGMNTTRTEQQSGMTLLEVMVAFMILTASAVPLLIALADSQRRVFDSQAKRTMKYLLEYKLAHVLLDRPPEDQDPIYVDGAEGNFGEEFDNSDEKSYWHDNNLYNYSYRIDSEELDMGTAGGDTGFEEEEAQQPEPEADPGGDPLGLGAATEEEELGQLRYRVTLTVFYRPGNANFDQHMSVVVFVKHPHQGEQMSGPDLEGSGPEGTLGAGEAEAGGGKDASGPTSVSQGQFSDQTSFSSSGSSDKR